MAEARDKIGICQWFHYQDYRSVERSIELMHDLGIRHLRTGISWADYHRPQGRAWYDWQMGALRDFELLLSIWHTPPSLSEGNCCASPPRRLMDYADFVAQVIDQYGDQFSHLELWNEPNNLYKWRFDAFDPDWMKFAGMVRAAAQHAQRCEVPTVLGGMMPVDHRWLQRMEDQGVLDVVDIVAIHSFPMMWWENQPCWDQPKHWHGWDEKIQYISGDVADRSIWVTETGLATWDVQQQREGRLQMQVQMLRAALAAPAQRVYWYSLIDLDPSREAIEGFHVDENEYHLGLVRWDGTKKPAWYAMRQLLRSDRPAVAAVPHS